MTQLTHDQYETLEQAVAKGTRLAIRRRGRREYVVVPLAIRIQQSREVVEARNPTTGHALSIFVDEIESMEAVK
jgi:hypothetical protein